MIAFPDRATALRSYEETLAVNLPCGPPPDLVMRDSREWEDDRRVELARIDAIILSALQSEGRGPDKRLPRDFVGAAVDVSHFPGRLTVNTGHGARRTTFSATLPRSTCWRPVRPCVLITMRSALRS